MKQIFAWMAKGMLAVLPIVITLYALFWLVTTAEGALAPVIKALFGPESYVPGLGLLVVAGALVGAGILIDAYVGRWFINLVEAVVDRLPLVKSIYAGVRDLVRFVMPGQGEEQARKVVAWQVREDAWLVGFVTGDPYVAIDGMGDADDFVSVYFPMSYQVGGYTVMLRERDLSVLDMTVEEGMRRVLTAGVAGRVTDGPHPERSHK